MIDANHGTTTDRCPYCRELLEALEGLLWLAESHFADKGQLEHLAFCRKVIAKAKGV